MIMHCHRPDRRAVLAAVDELLGGGEPVAVFFIVADDVEEIARVQGYPTAERLLKALGELAAASPVAQGGTIGCWGNSELVLVQPCADVSLLDRTAARLLRLLEGDHPVDDLLLATAFAAHLDAQRGIGKALLAGAVGGTGKPLDHLRDIGAVHYTDR